MVGADRLFKEAVKRFINYCKSNPVFKVPGFVIYIPETGMNRFGAMIYME